MSSIYDDFEEVIRRHREREAETQRATETNERFDKLETSINSLAESVGKLVKGSSPPPPASDDPTADPPGATLPASEDPPTPDPPTPELPVERVTRMGVPRVYTGDDEPVEVPYIDVESGETKKRPGRRKGQPTVWNVEAVEAPPEPPHEGET